MLERRPDVQAEAKQKPGNGGVRTGYGRRRAL